MDAFGIRKRNREGWDEYGPTWKSDFIPLFRSICFPSSLFPRFCPHFLSTKVRRYLFTGREMRLLKSDTISSFSFLLPSLASSLPPSPSPALPSSPPLDWSSAFPPPPPKPPKGKRGEKAISRHGLEEERKRQLTKKGRKWKDEEDDGRREEGRGRDDMRKIFARWCDGKEDEGGEKGGRMQEEREEDE